MQQQLKTLTTNKTTEILINMTVKDLFPDLYSHANKRPTPEEIEARQEAFSTIIENKETVFWKDVILLSLGEGKENVSSYKMFADSFRATDSTFPFTNNDNLIKVLAGIALMFKLEGASNKLRNFIALSISCSNFLRKKKSDFIQKESLSKSIEYLTQEAVLVRSVPLSVPKPTLKKYNVSKDLVNEANKLDNNKLKSNLTNISTSIANLVQAVKDLHESPKRVNILTEEVNILWWVFGGYSKDFDQSFSKLGIKEVVIIVGKELAEITNFIPGHYSSKAILQKILQNVKRSSIKVNIFDSVNSIDREKRKEIVEKYYRTEFAIFFPILDAISCSLQLEDDEDWAPLFSRNHDKKILKQSVETIELAYQIFNEIVAIKAYDILK